MSSNEVVLNPNCKEIYDTQLSMKRSNKNKTPLRWIIFQFNDDYSELAVSKEGPEAKGKSPKEEYDEFLAEFTGPKAPRLAVYDMQYTTKSGASHSAPVLLHFNLIDDSLPLFKKTKGLFMTAGGFRKLKETLNPKIEFKGDIESELEYELVLAAVEK